MHETAWGRVAETLNDIDFPAAKDEIVRHAQARGASDDAMRLLRALPLATYQNISEIRSSVPLDPAEDEGRSAGDLAGRARSQHVGVAGYLRED